MLTIDGSYGEGGGQILRTSASLAAITGQPVRIEKIRAGRVEPGLKAQHLTAIQAAMRVCNGHLEGAQVGATEVTMTPGSPVQPGHYEFDIGTAGSTALVFQTLLMTLLHAGAESNVSIIGGTHNTNAPSTDYLQRTFLPAAGLPARLNVERAGFFPRGGGLVTAAFCAEPLAPIGLTERGKRTLLTAVVTVSDNLPPHILERAGTEIQRRAEATGWPLSIILSPVPAVSSGMAVHLDASYENGQAGFTGLGRRGVPTERVIEDAWNELEAFDATGASVDEHLADQLILPALFATGPSEYRAARITEHLRTMAWLVPQFGVGTVTIDHATGHVRIHPKT